MEHMSHLEPDAEHATQAQDSSKLLGHAHLQECPCERGLHAASLTLLMDGSTTALRLQRDGSWTTVAAAGEALPGSMLGSIASRAVSCCSQQGQSAGYRLGALHGAAVRVVPSRQPADQSQSASACAHPSLGEACRSARALPSDSLAT